MGCGASFTRTPGPSSLLHASPKKTVHQFDALEASLQGSNIPEYARNGTTKKTVEVEIENNHFIIKPDTEIEADDLVEFSVNDGETYDIIQVYAYGKDFFKVPGGFDLKKINKDTEKVKSTIWISFDLKKPKVQLHFCVIPSASRAALVVENKCPNNYCKNNFLQIKRFSFELKLDDQPYDGRIYLMKHSELTIQWSGSHSYRFEHIKYCAATSGFYQVPWPSNQHNLTNLKMKGRFSQTFDEIGTSFLCRMDSKNQIHDIIVLTVNETFKIKQMKIGGNQIEPNFIEIDAGDIIEFRIKSDKKIRFEQIDPFNPAEKSKNSISRDPGESFSWPYDPTNVGFLYYKFENPGIYCFKTENGDVGTISVQVAQTLHRFDSNESKVRKLMTGDFVEFTWSVEKTPMRNFRIEIDRLSSVVPTQFDGLHTVFRCGNHRCKQSADLFERLHQSEMLIVQFVKHGVYQMFVDYEVDNVGSAVPKRRNSESGTSETSEVLTPNDESDEPSSRKRKPKKRISKKREDKKVVSSDGADDELTPGKNKDNQTMSTFIVLNGVDYHQVTYDQEGRFGEDIIVVNCSDYVVFNPVGNEVARIYETDAYGNILSKRPIFTPREKSVNYFTRQLLQPGIHHYRAVFGDDLSSQLVKSQKCVMAVVVVPEVQFFEYNVKNQNTSFEACINDYIIFYYQEPTHFTVKQIPSNLLIHDKIEDMNIRPLERSSHCRAIECSKEGTAFFIVPEIDGNPTRSLTDAIYTACIVDSPFSRNRIIIDDNKAYPDELFIRKDETVSFTCTLDSKVDSIFVTNSKALTPEQSEFLPHNIDSIFPSIHHLHTFKRVGAYAVFRDESTVIANINVVDVDSDTYNTLPQPEFRQPVNDYYEYNDTIDMYCESRTADIYFTINGSSPTERFESVRKYDRDIGVILNQSGLLVIRAFATAKDKISSEVVTSKMIFVKEDENQKKLENALDEWNGCTISLKSWLDDLNKVYNKIVIEPSSCTEYIDHFEYAIEDVVWGKLKPDENEFSIEGFHADKIYHIEVFAYPKSWIKDAQRKISNQTTCQINKRTKENGPLIGLTVSDDPSTIVLNWAPLGNHVLAYKVYVNDVETVAINDIETKGDYCIDLTDCKHGQLYNLRVDAETKKGILKSNVLNVSLPLEDSDKRDTRQREYLISKIETVPDDHSLRDSINYELLQTKTWGSYPLRSDGHTEQYPIDIRWHSATPNISYKRNPNGITLFWTKLPPSILSHIKNYCIMLDDKQYGPLISPNDEPRFHVNLSEGKHTCYVKMFVEDGTDSTFNSNVLKPNQNVSPKYAQDSLKQSRETSRYKDRYAEEKELPVPQVYVENSNPTTLRVGWRFNQQLPSDSFVAIYEIHVRGQNFMESIESDGCIQDDDVSEHVWLVNKNHIDIHGIPDREEYIVFVQALFYIHGVTELIYAKTTSKEVTTSAVDPMIDSIPRPILQVKELGLMTALLCWKVDEAFEKTQIKGYRMMINSKASQMIPPNQNEYRLENLKPGSKFEVQVALTTHPNFVEEKVSEPLHILCPDRPKPPVIRRVREEVPYSISIEWNLSSEELEDVTSFKIYLDGNLHKELDAKGRQNFKYNFEKLLPGQFYSIFVKSIVGHKQVDGDSYQCIVESNASNELRVKCVTPPKGTIPRVVKMNQKGLEIAWDIPTEYEEVKIIGYQILKDGRVHGKLLDAETRSLFIEDVSYGNRYSFQVLPITDQPGGNPLRTGEIYDPNRHIHYVAGPKTDIEFSDFLLTPEKIWVENVRGKTAVFCWTPLNKSKDKSVQPDSLKLLIWNDKDIKQEKPLEKLIPKDEKQFQLTDLDYATVYHLQVKSIQKRTHPQSKESFSVSFSTNVISFETGAPPEAPSNISLVSCTNTAARINFDSFVENQAEIITLRVQTNPVSSDSPAKSITMDLMPDSTELILINLVEKTTYRSTIYAITEEYLGDVNCRDADRLPKTLKPSKWLSHVSIEFTTGGCEPASNVEFQKANSEGIRIEWVPPKSYGSTQFIGQVVRWKTRNGDEKRTELDRYRTRLTIPGILVSGLYEVYFDALFSVKLNLEEENEANRKQICLTKAETVLVKFLIPTKAEPPQVFLTGYTKNSIEFRWKKPNMFEMIDHPEKPGEKLHIHRELLQYNININENNVDSLDSDQEQFKLTNCNSGEKYNIQVGARIGVKQDDSSSVSRDEEQVPEPEDVQSEKLTITTPNDTNFITSLKSQFKFNTKTESAQIEKNNPSEKQSIGAFYVSWEISDQRKDDISQLILQWHSSKDLKINQKIVDKTINSEIIEVCYENCFYRIELIVVDVRGKRNSSPALMSVVPGRPDPPKLWLSKQSNTSFVVEWSEPQTHGIPLIGFQLFVLGRKPSDHIDVQTRRAEISSRINHTYQITVQALTNHHEYKCSEKSEVLTVITTPTTSLVPKLPYHNDDGVTTSFDSSIARIIPMTVESVNEERLLINWASFLPTVAVKGYYVHSTCLNTGVIKVTKVSKRFREIVLKDLRPGFTYGILIIAVDKNGAVLYTSDKHQIQMNAPPNAPIIAITERTNACVRVEWRPPTAYGELIIVGYKVYVNNRLAAILRQNQFSYTLINGNPCETYTVHVQALSEDKNIVSPMSRAVEFSWPGIKPGILHRIDDGQSNSVRFRWDNPIFEDKSEKLVLYRLHYENLNNYATRVIGEYDSSINSVSINDVVPGKYRFWLEIIGEHHTTQTRAVIINVNRFNLLNRRQNGAELMNSPTRRISRSPYPGITNLRELKSPTKLS